MKLLFLILFFSFFLLGRSQTFIQKNKTTIEKTSQNSNIKEVNSATTLVCLFDGNDLVEDFNYYGKISHTALKEKINKEDKTYCFDIFIPKYINNTTLSLIDLPPPIKPFLT